MTKLLMLLILSGSPGLDLMVPVGTASPVAEPPLRLREEVVVTDLWLEVVCFSEEDDLVDVEVGFFFSAE
jgi:hypothetical protein